ncbi:MAG: RDD family protein [Prevotella sp.]|jgi:uncharacterized RDD family membrane protein YckC|nr:RDD family protein [Prevotella sp.]
MIIEVQTTQNVTIDYETAGIGYRLLAYFLDWVIIFIWYLGWVGIISIFSEVGLWSAFDGNGIMIFLIIIIAFPILFYDLLFETLNNGQSIGKMIVKIRVVNVDGTAPSSSSFLLRWLFRLVDFTMTEGFLAIIMIAVTKKSQRLGDYLAGTTVIDLRLNSKNKELKLSDLDFHEDYKVSYKDVLDRLSDRDIQTITSIIDDQRMQYNEYFNQRLADRIKSITGYEYDGPDRIFLRKIVTDYNYLAVQEQ